MVAKSGMLHFRAPGGGISPQLVVVPVVINTPAALWHMICIPHFTSLWNSGDINQSIHVIYEIIVSASMPVHYVTSHRLDPDVTTSLMRLQRLNTWPIMLRINSPKNHFHAPVWLYLTGSFGFEVRKIFLNFNFDLLLNYPHTFLNLPFSFWVPFTSTQILKLLGWIALLRMIAFHN